MSSIRPSSKITVSTFHPGPRAEHGFAGVHFATLVVEIRAIDKVSQKTREGRCPDTGRPAVFEAARRLFDDEASHSSVVVELYHVRPLILIGGKETHHEVGAVGVLALDEPAIDVRRLQEDVGESQRRSLSLEIWEGLGDRLEHRARILDLGESDLEIEREAFEVLS